MIGYDMPGVVQLKTLLRLMFISKNYPLIYAQSSILKYQLSFLLLSNSRLTNQVPALSCVIELSLVRVLRSGQLLSWSNQVSALSWVVELSLVCVGQFNAGPILGNKAGKLLLFLETLFSLEQIA
jgi:hypothetical protein